MRRRSKRYKKLKEVVKDKKITSVEDAINLAKKTSTAKFDESIDLNIRIKTKQKKGEINIRSAVKLPHGNGKKIKVAVLCEDSKLNDAKASGAEIYGSDSLINEINSGKINFDKIISTPGMMSKAGKLGKILGPKGLMPNPKLGTVTNDVKSAVNLIKSGQIEIKNDTSGNVGASIGKKSFSNEKIVENFNSVIEAILKERPAGVKGNFILSSFITSSMGISYKVKVKGA